MMFEVEFRPEVVEQIYANDALLCQLGHDDHLVVDGDEIAKDKEESDAAESAHDGTVSETDPSWTRHDRQAKFFNEPVANHADSSAGIEQNYYLPGPDAELDPWQRRCCAMTDGRGTRRTMRHAEVIQTKWDVNVTTSDADVTRRHITRNGRRVARFGRRKRSGSSIVAHTHAERRHDCLDTIGVECGVGCRRWIRLRRADLC